ncbi:tRNA adenosine deaminase-associated protein [Nocardia donostiensis]|uniref:tRNA adenosine deaminase n=1 Tax=Nocardia donostiensis TaxID=1538463 RepID=A0A1V2TAF7_9NOCA|nr:tRNA adenosine deaminase-associated protein [Nocardia donostiensis]ONM46485.1 tRNA adenosine deaminase [Nocardia donostiensis]OQS14276.1 tRNA adenosine deaminase [Nocardia donostiensis]OQS18115.1 tRNA adenosine deaminase [Nocardia donostiensis]
MATERSGTNRAASDDYGDVDGFAVAVVREDGNWRCTPLSSAALNNLSAAETELKALRSSGAVFGLIAVDDEFFVVVRPAPSGTRLLVSDATAAIDYDIAADVLEALNIDIPDIDPDELDDIEPYEEGDLAVLTDLGLPESVFSVILADTDLYPDEQLTMIAEELGFAGEFSAVLDKLPR